MPAQFIQPERRGLLLQYQQAECGCSGTRTEGGSELTLFGFFIEWMGSWSWALLRQVRTSVRREGSPLYFFISLKRLRWTHYEIKRYIIHSGHAAKEGWPETRNVSRSTGRERNCAHIGKHPFSGLILLSFEWREIWECFINKEEGTSRKWIIRINGKWEVRVSRGTLI